MYYAGRRWDYTIAKEANMRIEFRRTGKERKELVETIEKITGEKFEKKDYSLEGMERNILDCLAALK